MNARLARSARLAGFALLFSLGALWLGTPAVGRAADSEIIERVVAVVNEDAIFLSDLRRRTVPFLPQVMAASNEVERMARLEQLYRELLEKLVDEHLIEQSARKMQIHISGGEIERAIDNVRNQSGLDDDGFWDAVREQGLSRSQYRKDVRKQLLRLKVLNQRVRARVNITEEDVRERYDEMVRGARRRMRFQAAHVFLPVAGGATATEVAHVRRRAETLCEGLNADAFEDAMRQHGGGELGWLDQGDLPEVFESALSELDEGEVSEPVRGPAGYHIFLLQERKQGTEHLQEFEQARDALYQKMMEEAMTKQETLFLEDLRRKALIKKHL